MTRRTLTSLAVAAGAALALPAGASAAGLTYEGATLVYRAAPGEANAVTLNATDDGRVAIGETGASLSFPADGCSQANESMPVLCEVKSVDLLRFELGDGNDRASIQDIQVAGNVISVLAGDGNDRLEGGPRAASTLDGGAGDDELTSQESGDVLAGGAGDDQLIGGAGDDQLRGGDGADVLQPDRYTTGNDLVDGGAGIDRLQDYSDPTKSPQPVTVTLDGQANDGRPGERDDVRDVEHVRTYAGGTFVMSEGPDRVEVFTPSDQGPATVEGRGGADVLLAGVGRQTLDGGDGDDQLEGGFGDDVLTGGPGRDVIAADFTGSQCGWLQSCTVPHGNDVVHARDGEADTIDCGVGTDKAIVDRIDTVSECEEVDVPAQQQIVVPGNDAVVRPAVFVRGAKLRTALRSGLKVTLRGLPAGPVTVTARAGRRVVARGRGTAGAYGSARVVVRFTKAARRALARKRSVRLLVRAGAAGTTVTLVR